MLAGQAGSWQVFKPMHGIFLYRDRCGMQIAMPETPAFAHTCSPIPVCMLFTSVAAQEALSFNPVGTQSWKY